MTERERDETFDLQLHDFLAWQASDTAGAPTATDVAARIRSRVGAPSTALRLAPPRLAWVVLAGLLIAALLGLGMIGAGLLRPHPLSVVSNGWIAFSTQRGFPEVGHDYNGVGGDIYLVREGVEPRLIVGRGSANTSNVCPAFSPDGLTLVYGHRDGSSRALILLAVHADGSVSETARVDVPGGGNVPCPRWSRDGNRLAYLDVSFVGVPLVQPAGVVVRGLDGSTLLPEPGDPNGEDLNPHPLADPWPPLTSPSGEWVAFGDDRGALVERPDGSDTRVVLTAEQFARMIGYSHGERMGPGPIQAWSPDGKYVLAEADVSGLDFAMVAISVESPTQSIVLAPMVPVNCASCWPGRGDSSWQPVFGASTP